MRDPDSPELFPVVFVSADVFLVASPLVNLEEAEAHRDCGCGYPDSSDLFVVVLVSVPVYLVDSPLVLANRVDPDFHLDVCREYCVRAPGSAE